ncbi:MAG: MFS transporter [Gammaproteobacteria bacterium]|jgi:hypothetical protein|nr:MFS transporter [Gammaproteobacteria bacterium]
MSASRPHRENVWLNLGFNVVLPAIVLMQGKAWARGFWGGSEESLTLAVFLAALSLPLSYGLYDLVRRRKWNFWSLLGLVGVLMTGGIGLLRLPPEWVAVKEATVPGLLGLAVLVSHWTRRPLVRVLLLRDEFFDLDRIGARLSERDAWPAFEGLVRRANGLFALSFALSATLNYALAKWIVTSPAGTDAFNEELGRMTLLSYPIIALPTLAVTATALWLLFSGLGKLTGLELEEMMVHQGGDSMPER